MAGGPSIGDCSARVERASSKEVVISCTPEKGRAGPNHKFLYDPRAKALIKHLTYEPFPTYAVFPSGKTAVLVGSDRQRAIAIAYNPEADPAFRLLRNDRAASWTSKLPFTTGTSGTGPAQRVEIYLEPRSPEPLAFGPGKRFRLAARGEIRSSAEATALVITEQVGAKLKQFALPQSTYEAFSRARPPRVADGYSREATKIDEHIGPRQVADGTLWFGKTFCDGEGTTGVGGFGYFDADRREYRIYSPQEIKSWSVTALFSRRTQPGWDWRATENGPAIRADCFALIAEQSDRKW